MDVTQKQIKCLDVIHERVRIAENESYCFDSPLEQAAGGTFLVGMSSYVHILLSPTSALKIFPRVSSVIFLRLFPSLRASRLVYQMRKSYFEELSRDEAETALT